MVVDLPRCGPMLIRRVPNLVPIPGVTASAHCAVRPLEGPRDHRLAPPTRRAAPTGRPTRDHRRRPELARGDRGRATATEPSRVAGHRRHTVALAPPPHRRALDSTTATAGPAIDLSEASPTRAAPRSRESNLAISPRPGRTRQARPPDHCVHGLADPQQRRNRPRPHTLGSHLVAVPAVPGRRRLRLHHHRNRHAAQVLPPVLHRHPHPNRLLRRDHGPPHRRVGHPSSAEPVPAPCRRARRDACARARPRQPVHRRLRRDLQNRTYEDPQDARAHPRGERVRRTLDRHPATRAPRPHHHLEPSPAQQACRRLHRS